MSNRGCLLLLIFLALASDANSVSAQAPTLQVQVYDYTGLSASSLQKLMKRTQIILSGAGVSVEVDECTRATEGPCVVQERALRRIVIRVFDKSPKNQTNVRWPRLGESFISHEGGSCASVYRELADQEAADFGLPQEVVLAYVAAHEAGHLLLGEHAHTLHGLMKAHWDTEDFRAMTQSRLHFSSEQTRELTRRYGGSRPAEMGAGLVVATRR
jgi:hypothetical protein